MMKPEYWVKTCICYHGHVAPTANQIVDGIVYRLQTVINGLVIAKVVIVNLHGEHVVGPRLQVGAVLIEVVCNEIISAFCA